MLTYTLTLAVQALADRTVVRLLDVQPRSDCTSLKCTLAASSIRTPVVPHGRGVLWSKWTAVTSLSRNKYQSRSHHLVPSSTSSVTLANHSPYQEPTACFKTLSPYGPWPAFLQISRYTRNVPGIHQAGLYGQSQRGRFHT